ncbi:MAG TPA: hypothetical protein VG028_10685 [Terriglobia bacterium]|nr:hypothetical protein [Terriglobia bacterium]
MKNSETQPEVDTRTLDGLLDDLREVEQRLCAALKKLDGAARLSDEYHDSLAEIYTLMTWMSGLAPEIQVEMERVDDQLPDD